MRVAPKSNNSSHAGVWRFGKPKQLDGQAVSFCKESDMSQASAHAKKNAASEMNQIKSRLIDQLKKLEAAQGCKGAASELGSIIGRLEHWQAKHG